MMRSQNACTRWDCLEFEYSPQFLVVDGILPCHCCSPQTHTHRLLSEKITITEHKNTCNKFKTCFHTARDDLTENTTKIMKCQQLSSEVVVYCTVSMFTCKRIICPSKLSTSVVCQEIYSEVGRKFIHTDDPPVFPYQPY